MNFADLDSKLTAAVTAAVMDDGTYTPLSTGVAVPVRLAVSYLNVELGVRMGNVQSIQLPLASCIGWQRGDQITFGKTYLIEKRQDQDSQFITFTVRDAAKEGT